MGRMGTWAVCALAVAAATGRADATEPAADPTGPDATDAPAADPVRDTWYVGVGVRLMLGMATGELRGEGAPADQFGGAAGGGVELVLEWTDVGQLALSAMGGSGGLNRELLTELGAPEKGTMARFLRGGAVVRVFPWVFFGGLRPFAAAGVHAESVTGYWEAEGDCLGGTGGNARACEVGYAGWSVAPGLGLRWEGTTAPTFGARATQDLAAVYLQADYAFDLLGRRQAAPGEDFEDRPELIPGRPDIRRLWFSVGGQYLF